MKAFTTTVVIFLALAAAAAPARAQSEEDPCAPEAQRSPQLMACAGRQFREASADLKRVRDGLNAEMEARSRVRLRAAERAWLRYRKTNCDAEASHFEGGTIQPLIQLRCMTRVTRDRAAELKAQLQTLRG